MNNEQEYQRYMRVIELWIKETKRRNEMLHEYEEVYKLSFDEWCKFQNKK